MNESGYVGSVDLVDPATLNDVELRDAARSLEHLTGKAQAGQLAVLAEMARREETGPENCSWIDPLESLTAEIATELAVTTWAASDRLDLATGLTRFPATGHALADGTLDLPKVRTIVDQLTPLTAPGGQYSEQFAELVPVVEASAITYGATHTRTQLAAWLRRRVLLINPGQAEQDHQDAVADRRVVHQPGPHGTSTLWAQLPAHDALAIWRMIDQLAHTTGIPETEVDTDERTIDQRRADALVDLVTGNPASTPAVDVQVTVSAETLAGLDDQPGHLAGYGPITPTHARQLATGDSRWHRLLTDPVTGGLLELSQAGYRPNTHLARTILTRDGTCRFPGCRRNTGSTGIDLDHTIDWPTGPTAASNLAALCRHHHNLKTHADWHVEQLAHGALQWTTPTGRIFRTHPNGIPPD